MTTNDTTNNGNGIEDKAQEHGVCPSCGASVTDAYQVFDYLESLHTLGCVDIDTANLLINLGHRRDDHRGTIRQILEAPGTVDLDRTEALLKDLSTITRLADLHGHLLVTAMVEKYPGFDPYLDGYEEEGKQAPAEAQRLMESVENIREAVATASHAVVQCCPPKDSKTFAILQSPDLESFFEALLSDDPQGIPRCRRK